MEKIIKSYLQSNYPFIYVEIVCNEIKEKIKDIELPELEEYKDKFNKYLNLPKSLNFKKNIYGLAEKFELLRRIFLKLYSKIGNEVKELKIVVDYLQAYNKYFDWIQSYINRKFYKEDPIVFYATKYLKFEIEVFIYKYEFLIKSKEDVLLDALNISYEDDTE